MRHKLALVPGLLVFGLMAAGCAHNPGTENARPAARGFGRAMAETSFKPLDLTDYYDKRAGSWPAGSSWSAVPWGRRTCDGVPFQWGGILEVTGMDAARVMGEVFPGRCTGIPVGRAAPWIHLVHGVGWREADGVPIARLTLHYDNGQTSTFQIRYGVNVRNWWKEPSEQEAALGDSNSRLIWSAPSPERVGRPITLRLYKTSFPNPHPRWVITALDIESLFTHATPVVVALTVGPPGEGVSPQRVASVPIYDRVIEKVLVTAAGTGQPISGARLQIVLSDGQKNYSFGEQATDAEGRTVLDFSRVQTYRLSLNVTAPGYQALRFSTPILNLARELDLKLESQREARSATSAQW